jgi:hypothetical protein
MDWAKKKVKKPSRARLYRYPKEVGFSLPFSVGRAISDFPDLLTQINLDLIRIHNTKKYLGSVPIYVGYPTCLIRLQLGLGPTVPSSRLTLKKKIWNQLQTSDGSANKPEAFRTLLKLWNKWVLFNIFSLYMKCVAGHDPDLRAMVQGSFFVMDPSLKPLIRIRAL